MTENEGKPPDKRKRRPGQEAASRVKAKVNNSDSATNSTALSRSNVYHYPRFGEHLDQIYPAIFPHGHIVSRGKKFRLDRIEIDLKSGHWRDTTTGNRGKDLDDLALALGQDEVFLRRRRYETMAPIIAESKATMLASLPISPDIDGFEEWLRDRDRTSALFRALLPEGQLNDRGQWCAWTLEIELQGPKAGWATNSIGPVRVMNPLNTLHWITGEPWPWSFGCVARIVVDIQKRALAQLPWGIPSEGSE